VVGEDRRAVAQRSVLLFSSMRITYVVGPVLAGGLIAAWGEPTVLFIDAASFLVAALLLLRFVPAVERALTFRNSPACSPGCAFSPATRS